MKSVLRALLACLTGTLCLHAQTGQLDASSALFSVMAALNAAGYDQDAESANNHPLRKAVTDHLKSKNLASVAEIKSFLEKRRQTGKQLELARFISFALSVEGAPAFKYKFQPHEMPPDVVPLEGFDKLMVAFHAEADMETVWKQVQPHVDKVLAGYQEQFVKTINHVNAYLRNPTSGYIGRRFQIYVELLGPPNQVQTREYKDDYYIVLTPSPEPQLDFLRYAYIRYLLDPLSFKYKANLEKKKPLLDLAGAAPALEEYYKNDFQLLTTACLAKAVEARIRKNAALADQALKEGFILAPYFNEALGVYEKQEVAMRLYYPEMIDAIDLKKEDKRLASVEFVSTRPVRTFKSEPREPKPTGVFKTLEDAEDLYRLRKWAESKPVFLRALQETDEKPLHAKAYYGLARIAVQQRDPELAVKLFEKALDLSPDGAIRSLSHVNLGHLWVIGNEPEKAVEQYKAALAVAGISPAAKKAAENGLKEITQRSKEKE
ncbi:MAG: tetratricopeptide repeat protein [Acidobacteria bacterium]|nr:tetratricopeptide repeat protein [Acidobacteriota bacterium]